MMATTVCPVPVELDSGIGIDKLPVDSCLGVVSSLLPSSHFGLDLVEIVGATAVGPPFPVHGKIGDVVELVEIPRRVILKCLGSGRGGSMPPGITGCAANQDRSATPCIAPATHFLPAKTQRTEQNYSRKSATSSSFHSLSHLFGGLEQAQSTLFEVLLKASVDPMALAKYAVS